MNINTEGKKGKKLVDVFEQQQELYKKHISNNFDLFMGNDTLPYVVLEALFGHKILQDILNKEHLDTIYDSDNVGDPSNPQVTKRMLTHLDSEHCILLYTYPESLLATEDPFAGIKQKFINNSKIDKDMLQDKSIENALFSNSQMQLWDPQFNKQDQLPKHAEWIDNYYTHSQSKQTNSNNLCIKISADFLEQALKNSSVLKAADHAYITKLNLEQFFQLREKVQAYINHQNPRQVIKKTNDWVIDILKRMDQNVMYALNRSLQELDKIDASKTEKKIIIKLQEDLNKPSISIYSENFVKNVSTLITNAMTKLKSNLAFYEKLNGILKYIPIIGHIIKYMCSSEQHVIDSKEAIRTLNNANGFFNQPLQQPQVAAPINNENNPPH